MSEREMVLIEVVDGSMGPSLSIGDGETGYRLSGPKPWGGGKTLHTFKVKASELVREALSYCPKSRADLAAEQHHGLVEAFLNEPSQARRRVLAKARDEQEK